MPVEKSGFRGCYRHPERVAIRDCACCGRPICKGCVEESKDDLLCLPCKQELESLEEEQKEPVIEEGYRVGQDRAKLDLSDMTVFDDGTVIAPPETSPRKETADMEGSSAEKNGDDVAGEKEDREEQGAVSDTGVLVDAGQKEGSAVEPAGEDLEDDTSSLAETEVPEYEEPWLRLKEPISFPAGGTAKTVVEEIDIEPGGPGRQILSAVPYVLLAAGTLTCIWLIIALVSKQWSQASVFTMGIVVPWVLYKGSLVKKRFGKRVWNEPPPALMMSVTSIGIMAVVVPLMEYFAFMIVSSGEALLPFSDFMQRYFKPTGWMLVVLGIMLAVLIPFLVGKGSPVSRSTFQRNKE
ncbi:MAG: hypothetical protein JW738_03465 [Actinobacteria bacterium]|nr:hypothetical protein [Actinomycetota bacterium]